MVIENSIKKKRRRRGGKRELEGNNGEKTLKMRIKQKRWTKKMAEVIKRK